MTQSVGDTSLNQRHQLIQKLSRWLVYVLLIGGAFIVIFPLITMVTTAFKSFTEINTYPPTFLPKVWFPSNFPDAITYPGTNFPRWTFNTLFILFATLPGVLFTASVCAYGFARIEFRGRNFWFMLTLASVMLPPQVTLIPLYILFQKIGWLNTFAPLIIPAWFGGGAINIFLIRQFFMQIPRELDEAAVIDGAGHVRIWWSIYVPLSRPILVTVALLTTLQIWNDFFGPLVYLTTPDNFTLGLGLNQFQGLFETRNDYIMAISTIMVIPMILMFIFAQRYIVQGFAFSGIKS